MRFTSISVTSPSFNDFQFTPTESITVIRGRYSDTVLDLMRGATENYEDSGCDGNLRFTLHADVELDGKEYSILYISNDEELNDSLTSVKLKDSGDKFSFGDALDFINKCNEINTNDLNIFDREKLFFDAILSEGELWLRSFDKFLSEAPENDTRPLFIYGLLDRIDEATDILPLFEKLAALERQVYISVCPAFSSSRLKGANAQLVDTE